MGEGIFAHVLLLVIGISRIWILYGQAALLPVMLFRGLHAELHKIEISRKLEGIAR